jgi:hypothetical protein
MSSAYSPKAIIYCCLLTFFVSCRSDKSQSHALSPRAEYENYQKQFVQLDQNLRSALAHTKSIAASSTLDSTQLLTLGSIDKKADAYQQRITERLARYNTLLQKAENGQILEAEMTKYRTDYINDFKSIEDAYQQMETALKGIQEKNSQ